MTDSSQYEFPSLAFPKDRKVLRVGEVAARWRVSVQHVLNLLEEGNLAGFDVAGSQREYMRIPAAAVDALAARFRVSREVILDIFAKVKPRRGTSRAFWRIPVEGYGGFIADNHSLAEKG